MRDSLVSIWSTDDLSHAEFSRARHHTFAFEPHFHGTVCLALIVSGALKLTIGRRTETAAKGSLVVINAGDVHAGHATSVAQGWVMRTLHVAPGNLARQMRNQGLPAGADFPIRSGIRNERRLADLFFGERRVASQGGEIAGAGFHRPRRDLQCVAEQPFDRRCGARGKCCLAAARRLPRPLRRDSGSRSPRFRHDRRDPRDRATHGGWASCWLTAPPWMACPARRDN
jgi:AraC-like ligand binding domain